MAQKTRLTAGAIKVAEWRRNLSVSQEKAAAQIGIRQQMYSRVESGRFIPTNYDLVLLLQSGCGVSPSDWKVFSRKPVAAPVARKSRASRVAASR